MEAKSPLMSSQDLTYFKAILFNESYKMYAYALSPSRWSNSMGTISKKDNKLNIHKNLFRNHTFRSHKFMVFNFANSTRMKLKIRNIK
jgi:hypothetical protein